jgi:hypothetical protein
MKQEAEQYNLFVFVGTGNKKVAQALSKVNNHSLVELIPECYTGDPKVKLELVSNFGITTNDVETMLGGNLVASIPKATVTLVDRSMVNWTDFNLRDTVVAFKKHVETFG